MGAETGSSRNGLMVACEGDWGLPCEFEERDIRMCPVCNNEVDREDMDFTRDCHGITFRLVCHRCWERLMSKGYDGEHYTEADEQIEDDY